MKYIKSGRFKRLFSIRRRSTSSDDSSVTLKERQSPISEKDNYSHKPIWKCFSFDEIFTATNGFSSENLVGKGGYAEVYRGELKNGEMVAVKKLKISANEERREKEFLTEIGTIVHVFHPNVSSLLGFCLDNGLYLLFPFSPRGCVSSLLHDKEGPPLEWKIRHKIAIGTAKGLHYLHKGCQRRIIHRDIKASNILLTQDFEPQISDFGLAKWLPTHWTHRSIAPIEGTVGYLAPEYFSHGQVDEKTDVFAFGVFLLELISGKKPVDASHQSLSNWAKPFLKQGDIEKLIDPRLNGAYDEIETRSIAFAASLCIRTSTIWRPTMTEARNPTLVLIAKGYKYLHSPHEKGFRKIKKKGRIQVFSLKRLFSQGRQEAIKAHLPYRDSSISWMRFKSTRPSLKPNGYRIRGVK